MIISLLNETDVNRIECTEGSAFYTIQNTHSYKSQFSLLVPQNKLLNGMPEVQIRPNCTYKIQVHANPRARPVGKLPEVRKVNLKKSNIMPGMSHPSERHSSMFHYR